MRTPKIEALHRLIDWLNQKDVEENILKKKLDSSPIESNAWLPGFIEADGNFYINFKVNERKTASHLKYYMRLTQKQYYNKDVFLS